MKRTIKMKVTILMVIHMCKKYDEDDADVDPKYSEERTQYYALPLILLMEITSVHIGALHVSQTIFFVTCSRGW